MTFLMGEPHYISVLRRPGSRILVRSPSLTQTVLMTGERIESKAWALSLQWDLVRAAAATRSGLDRGVARGLDTYRIRM